MTASKPTRSSPPDTPLDEALLQTQKVQDRLSSGAQEIFIVGEVLKQELPREVRTDDVAQALEKHEALEETVQECADDLEDVTKALAKEVAHRELLERKLHAAEQAVREQEASND